MTLTVTRKVGLPCELRALPKSRKGVLGGFRRITALNSRWHRAVGANNLSKPLFSKELIYPSALAEL